MHPHEMVVRCSKDKFKNEKGEIFCAAIKESTTATYSLGNRAFYFEGVICKGTETGEYLIRLLDGNNYIVTTRFSEPYCPSLDVVYLTQTNTLCNLQRQNGTKKDEFDNETPLFENYAINVKVYLDTVIRPLKESNDGQIDETLRILTIPHKYEIGVLDRVVIVDEKGTMIEKYQSDSINDVLIIYNRKYDGVDIVQLVLDVRT